MQLYARAPGAASALPRSATTPLTRAAGTLRRSASNAAVTRASLRPLITTSAPSAASARAVAQPMPAVDPVTSARLSSIPRSMNRTPESMRSINLRHRRARSHYSAPRQTRLASSTTLRKWQLDRCDEMDFPRDPGLDNTLALLREGYFYIPNRCRRYHSDEFKLCLF